MSAPIGSSNPKQTETQSSEIFALGQARKTFNKGLVLRFKKEIPQAIEVIEKAQRLFKESDDTLGVIYALIELAWLYGATQERPRSEKLFNEAEIYIQANRDLEGIHEVKARLLHYKGLLFYQSEDFGSALKHFKEALGFCQPQGLEAAKIYDSLGVHYERTGDFHRAIRYLKLALMTKVQNSDLIHEEAITCQILGRLYLLYEDYELAFKHLQRSFDICAELKDEKRKASLKNEMIRLFLRCGNEVEAQRLISEVLEECHNHRHLKIQLAMAHFFNAYLLYQSKDFQSSRRILERDVFPIFQKSHYRKGIAMAKRLQAWLEFSEVPHQTTVPVALICEAIEYFRQENIIDEVAKSYFELGKLYLEMKNEKLALASFLDSLRIAEENGLFYLTPYIEDEIFRTHEDQWREIVTKRSRHERVFEKRNSLLEALKEIMASPAAEEGQNTSNAGDIDPTRRQNIPFLISLLTVGQAMAAERDLDKLLGLIKNETERALNAERCAVFLYDAETNELWSKMALQEEGSYKEIRFPAHQGLAGYVVKTGDISNIENASADPRFNPEVDGQDGFKTTSMLCIPMRNRKGDIIGVFQVLNKTDGIFQRHDEELLMAIASSAGIAIENAQLYQELRITFESFIKTLSSTIDARDPITAGHSERVMVYALLIGNQMHLSEDEMEALKYAALLHDIGKIGVREDILIKAGRLTENEYRHIQQHVYYTHEILKNIRFEKHLSSVPDIAASHHEKMDGSGYYRGLKGEQIPLGGRVLAIADVFDAITSRRQYRARMPFDRVIKVLREEADRHFDVSIVAYFMDVSLKDIGRVLCMDPQISVSVIEMEATLMSIPEDFSIAQYLEALAKRSRTAKEEQIHHHFNHLYHFSEISDLD